MRNHCLELIITKKTTTKNSIQNIFDINLLQQLELCQSQMLRQINVRNETHDFEKNQIRSDAIVPVHFRAQHQAEYSSLQLMVNCIAAKSCLSTLYQTDLRIGNHRRHKSPPSLTLLSFYTQIKWPYLLTTTEAFRAYFKLLCLR